MGSREGRPVQGTVSPYAALQPCAAQPCAALTRLWRCRHPRQGLLRSTALTGPAALPAGHELHVAGRSRPVATGSCIRAIIPVCSVGPLSRSSGVFNAPLRCAHDVKFLIRCRGWMLPKIVRHSPRTLKRCRATAAMTGPRNGSGPHRRGRRAAPRGRSASLHPNPGSTARGPSLRTALYGRPRRPRGIDAEGNLRPLRRGPGSIMEAVVSR